MSSHFLVPVWMESNWTIILRWTFLWCCLPVRFSWSRFFVQMTNEYIRSSCLGPAGSHIVFVDKASVRDKLSNACESFDQRGLKTHEQEVQSGIVTCLGNQLDCVEHRSSPTDVRFSRFKRALEYAWSLKRLPGRIWEVILGHCTFLGLQERGCLSAYFTIYLFIRKNCCTSQPLWDSAREELVCFWGLMYFLQGSWRAPWSRIVTVGTDT